MAWKIKGLLSAGFKKNIQSFGGDPKKVTIMGESAGGSSVCLQMLMPKSGGLFSQAIIESGACFVEARTLQEGFNDGRTVTKTVGCEARQDLLRCLRETNTTALLKAQATGVQVTAVVDKYNLMEHPYVTLTKGKIPNVVPLIAGSTSDEGTLFVYPGFPHGLSPSDYATYVTRLYSVFAPAVLLSYPCAAPETDCRPVLSEVIGDFTLSCPTFIFTQSLASTGTPTWAYLWGHEPNFQVPQNPFLGAYHSSEIAFVFSTFADIYPFVPAETLLSQQMTTYWTSFGISGNPNGQSLPDWQAYNVAQNRLVLNTTIYPSKDLLTRCRFWNSFYANLYK